MGTADNIDEYLISARDANLDRQFKETIIGGALRAELEEMFKKQRVPLEEWDLFFTRNALNGAITERVFLGKFPLTISLDYELRFKIRTIDNDVIQLNIICSAVDYENSSFYLLDCISNYRDNILNDLRKEDTNDTTGT